MDSERERECGGKWGEWGRGEEVHHRDRVDAIRFKVKLRVRLVAANLTRMITKLYEPTTAPVRIRRHCRPNPMPTPDEICFHVMRSVGSPFIPADLSSALSYLAVDGPRRQTCGSGWALSIGTSAIRGCVDG